MERSAIAWDLAIELLADLKQIQIPVLQAAVERTTGSCDDASGSVKEKVALRHLEKLSDSAGEASTSGSDAHIDQKLSVEEVLCRHIRKMGTLEISRKGSRTNWSKYELEHFVLQKKSMLQKCSLDSAKESILKSQSQLLSVLKDFNVLPKWCEVDKGESNRCSEKEDIEKLKLQTADEILTAQQQAPVSEPDIGVVILGDDPFRAQQHLSKEIDGTNADRRDQLQMMSVGTGGEIAELLLHNFSPQMADKEKGTLHQSPLDGVKEYEDQPIHEEGHSVGGHCMIPEAPVGDCHYGLTINFDPGGAAFGFQEGGLKSQISVDIDSITGDGIRKGSCIKCKEGGPLLICTTEGCIVTAHEKCFGSVTPNFDEKGLFCCPFCSFKIASLAYCRAKKNLSQAEKALKDFSGWGFVTRVNEKKASGMEVSRGKGHEHETNSMKAAEEEQRVPAARVRNEGDKVIDTDATANNHQKIVQFQHFHQAGGANAVNYDGMPHNAIVPPAFKVAEINDTNKEKQIGDEGFVLEQVHDLAEPHAVDGTREDHYEVSQLRHFQQIDAANLVNDGEVLHNAVVPPAWNPTEANHNYKEKEHGNGCETLEEVHNSAKAFAVDDARNHQHGIMQLQHFQQTCVANPANDGNMPYATGPPAFEIAEANHIDEVKQTGDGNQNVSYQEVDMLQHGNDAVENRKDIGIHQKTIMEVQNGKKTNIVTNDGIQCSPNQESGSSATHIKKRKLDLAIENNLPAGTTVDDENRVKSSPENHKERHRRLKRHWGPTFRYPRRDRIHWTSEEEEILKAGVKKFARGSEAFPWARILEFGQGIFHENRLPADLKDKWRNIRIREDKVKMTRIKDF